MAKNRIDSTGFILLVILTILWGVNYFAIKVSCQGISPIFTTFLRNLVASVCGIAYCLAVRRPLFHRDIRLFHGFMVGLLFGGEFVCLYLGMIYTDATRAVVFVYLSPFVVAIGAHIFLRERLNAFKMGSIVFAFLGLCLVIAGKPRMHAGSMVLGDSLEMAAGVLWGATTLYIKKYLADRIHPINTFLYQFVFSLPLIIVCAYLLEPKWVTGAVTSAVLVSLFYQTIIVAFASFLVWFWLIHEYPVGGLSVFTFLTPVFGVASGVLFLGEALTKGLVIGLICVCIGIYGTNYSKPDRSFAPPARTPE